LFAQSVVDNQIAIFFPNELGFAAQRRPSPAGMKRSGISVRVHGFVMLHHAVLIPTNPYQKEHFFPGSFHDDIVGNS
jgi:hypothetical protein